MLGIDRYHGLVYEGVSKYGHAIWPSPVTSNAIISHVEETANPLPNDPFLPGGLIFREDSFDPVTRVRRGRLYSAAPTQPEEWFVQQHPAFPNEHGYRDQLGRLGKLLNSFENWNAPEDIVRRPTNYLIALGSTHASTRWKLIGIERISTGEYLVILKAAGSFGILPALDVIKIPESGRSQVVERYEKVVEAAHREGSPSIIDRCRDLAQSCLGLAIAEATNDQKSRFLDLGQLVLKAQALSESKTTTITMSIANVLAKLHSRSKPNEQLRYGSRVPDEWDAEFGIMSVAMLLRELSWTKDH